MQSNQIFILLLTIYSFPQQLLADPIDLGDFKIDKTEVTVGAFGEYANRTGLVTDAETEGGGFEWGAGWQRRTGWNFRNPTGKPAHANEPAVHVSWAEANAYCIDAGGRLPTKAEWVRAAYTELRPDPTDGFKTGKTYTYPVGDLPDGMNNNRISHVRVGTTKRGVNGLFDMGANVWEWLSDTKEDNALTAGGSWWYGAEKTRVTGMQWKPVDFYVVYIGFRCVY